MQNNNFIFILSNITFEQNNIPFSISENILIRAATEQEIIKFKSDLGRIYGHFFAISNATESILWVLKFTNDVDLYDLAKIACLVNPKIYFELNIKYTEPNEHGISAVFDSTSYRSVIEKIAFTQNSEQIMVSIEELNKLKKYYNELTTLPEISMHALDMFYEASTLSINSELLTLSLFSIIESLITHKPRLTETLDSITHQIKNKLNLLSKRFDCAIEHRHYFGAVGFQTLLNKLYALRSDIAHGQMYSFTSGDYQLLRNLENVNKFLDEIVREIIKLSINEFQLIEDIKAC